MQRNTALESCYVGAVSFYSRSFLGGKK